MEIAQKNKAGRTDLGPNTFMLFVIYLLLLRCVLKPDNIYTR